MLRTIVASAAATFMIAGVASAQGPGAADVGEYHERFVRDADPTDGVLRSGIAAERRALAADPVFDEPPIFEETITFSQSPAVVSRSPAAIPGRAPAADPGLPPQNGLTPGAPLGTDPVTGQKVVAGERR